MDRRLVVLHIANLTDDKSKGPNNNVPKNIIYGNKYANVALYNLSGEKIAVQISKDRLFSGKDYKTIDCLPAPFNNPDIVVFQGVYFIHYCRIAKWLNDNSIPYIIVPRCSMTSAALRSHALKKKTANFLLFNRFIRNAKKIQFLTKNEYIESKNNFKFKDYYILGNGVEMPAVKYKQKNRDVFKIVFIGRYNIYHKGLDVLLDAIAENKQWFEDNSILVLLYGSDSDNGLKYLNKRIVSDNLDNIVKICGPVFGTKKEEAFLDADVFIHTSRLEGQPTSVVEAISYGVPVIVTPGTNVADIVLDEKLGFVAESDSKSVFDSIKKSFEMEEELINISKTEINYSRKNFEWSQIIIKSLELYNGGKE